MKISTKYWKDYIPAGVDKISAYWKNIAKGLYPRWSWQNIRNIEEQISEYWRNIAKGLYPRWSWQNIRNIEREKYHNIEEILKRFISSVELTKVMSDLGERLSEEEVTTSCRCLGWWWWCWSWWWWWCRCWRWWCWSWWLYWWLLFADFGLCGHYLYKAGADKGG